MASGNWNKVPVDDGLQPLGGPADLAGAVGITDQGYVDRVNAIYGDKAPKVLELYPRSRFKTPYDAITQVTTDAGRACQTEVAAKALNAQVPTFRYEFNDPTSPTLYGFTLRART